MLGAIGVSVEDALTEGIDLVGNTEKGSWLAGIGVGIVDVAEQVVGVDAGTGLEAGLVNALCHLEARAGLCRARSRCRSRCHRWTHSFT